MYVTTFIKINSLPHNKILDLSKLKAFADDKINVTNNSKFAYVRIKNYVGKGVNAGYLCFCKASFSRLLRLTLYKTCPN